MGKQVEELRATLRDEGVVLVRGLFAPESLLSLRDAACLCFAHVEDCGRVPENYGYNRNAHSVRLAGLLDFGIEGEDTLVAPLATAGLDEMFSDLLEDPWLCRLEHCWVRKKFAPQNAPASGYAIQDWHQDGALGATFPLEPGPVIAATSLATCWIPLQGCGRDSPGLEFIRMPQPTLLHFTELDDALLRKRFEAASFWAPAMEFGDGLVFRNDLLHRTYLCAGMHANRISIEYRVFAQRG